MVRQRIVSDDGYSTEDQSDSSGNESDNYRMPEILEEPEFGILFDVDGVIARGSTPLTPAQEAVKKYLTDDIKDRKLRVPVAFVTNGCNRSVDKAKQISKWLDVDVDPATVIHAPTPSRVLTEFHGKHVLVIGQEKKREIANDLGFTNLCFLSDLRDHYPLLDYVDHKRRASLAFGFTEKKFPKIEAILLLGEPVKWESNLQLIIDLLLTEGVPTRAPVDPTKVPQLPIIACNMDLQFMAEACMPRFGHGAFLVCLEALFKKITGNDLQYKVLIGKPCELTYRYAEFVISREAKRLGNKKTIKRLYFMGDNHQVDVVGANLYDRYIRALHSDDGNGNTDCEIDLPLSRKIPSSLPNSEQTVERCYSLLVCTGVYQPSQSLEITDQSVYHGHRDIENDPELIKPTKVVKDVLEGIKFVFKMEGIRRKSKKSTTNLNDVKEVKELAKDVNELKVNE